MTIETVHAFVSGKSDGGDATVVKPSDWNELHDITMSAGKVMGRDSSGSGAVQELALSFDASSNPDFNVGVGGLGVPTGTTAQRLGSARNGVFRFNTTLALFEGRIAAAWVSILSSISPAITGTATLVNATLTGLLQLVGLAETYVVAAITSGTLTINLATATVFNVANTGNITTFTISNATASKVNSFTLFFTGDGTARTQVWGGSVKWAAGSAPVLTSTNGKVDVITFVSNNGGTTWYGFVGGLNF